MKPLFTRAQILAEAKWRPTPTVYCESCGERKRDCVCTPSYVYRRKEEDLPLTSDWMD